MVDYLLNKIVVYIQLEKKERKKAWNSKKEKKNTQMKTIVLKEHVIITYKNNFFL